MTRIELMQGWTLEVKGPGDFEIANFGPDGERRFYVIEPGPYSPIIREEPELALELGDGNFVDAQGNPASPSMKMKGIICKSAVGESGEILYRGNMTNFLGRDGGQVEDGGKFVSVKGTRYILYRLVAENKNRITGYIGAYIPVGSSEVNNVQIMEIENLL